MNPERGQRVYTVFEATLWCDPAGRAALLDTLCGDDAGLRAEIERLETLNADVYHRGGAFEMRLARLRFLLAAFFRDSIFLGSFSAP
jgi:hypothetical protein